MASKKKRRRSRGKRRVKQRRSWLKGVLWFGAVMSLIGLGVVAVYVGWLNLDVRARFDGKRWAVPARIYARPLEMYAGMRLSADEFAQELAASGYHATERLERRGSFHRTGDTFQISTRAFEFWDSPEPARQIRLRFAGNTLETLEQDGGPLPLARLDPALFGRIYPTHQEDRILVKLDRVPPLLVDALLAVEDRNFFKHGGVSLRGIARAVWANLRAGAAVQGGSTLTQQLAKNFFLTHERSLWRKINDATIALLLEYHYTKEEILEAYLNEIFLGQEGKRAVHGFGLAAHFYFGRPLNELQLPEFALLVALVRGASYYNPRRQPARARDRRNLVIDVLYKHDRITAEQRDAAKAKPLGVTGAAPKGSSRYPAFFDLVKRQLRRDYREEDLRSEGLRIFTTLDPRIQHNAEVALSQRLQRVEKRRDIPAGELQGAVVVTRPQSGEVLALVGGRDAREAGFNRTIDAVRPVGSLIKPAVYLTALEQSDRYNLVTALADEPVGIDDGRGNVWAPQNYDKQPHGPVPLYAALAHSYNLATVRLGMEVGLDEVLRTLERLGVRREIPAYPSMLLGAVNLAPIEVAQMYQTIASGGFRVPLRAIREVTDAQDEPLARYGLSVEQVFDPGPMFLTTTALQQVMRVGTGRSVYARLPSSLKLAGKTGTTGGLRDSWFAGFSDDSLAVVWLGRDDNKPAGLTGASGALRVWTDLMLSLRPRSLSPQIPESVEWYWTDVNAMQLTDASCPDAVPMPYIVGSAPAYGACIESAAAWETIGRAGAEGRQGDRGASEQGKKRGFFKGMFDRLGDIFQ